MYELFRKWRGNKCRKRKGIDGEFERFASFLSSESSLGIVREKKSTSTIFFYVLFEGYK